jgi:pyruvate-formate lyase
MVRKKSYQTPNLTCRIHRNTPDKLWNAIVDTLATGTGLPALYNDDVVCTALEKVGINIMDTSGNLKQMDVILEEMAARWDTLGKAEQTALA